MKSNQNLIGTERTVTRGVLTGALVKVMGEQEDGYSCILLQDFKPYKTGDEVYLEKYELV